VQDADRNALLQHLVRELICAVLGANEEYCSAFTGGDLGGDDIFVSLVHQEDVVQHVSRT
jgi:hypothetical protein